MTTVISRDEAISQGLPRYFTGTPCKHGHLDERRVGDMACVACRRVKGRKRSPEQIRQQNKNYKSKNAVALRKYNREWRAKNRAWFRAYHKERNARIADLIAALRLEMPEILKRFGI